MGLINTVKNKIKERMRSFINFQEPVIQTITIRKGYDRFTANGICRIWYNGKAWQLSELYRNLDYIPSSMFWKVVPTRGQDIRKIHIPLPKLIVDTITEIVVADFNGIEINNESSTYESELWATIEKENDLTMLIDNMLTDIGIVGDGAFKISYDKSISDLPIIEWYEAERVEFLYCRGKIREVKFTTEYVHDNKKYYFVETYGYGYIRYSLLNSENKEIPFDSIEETSWVDSQGVEFDSKLMWAVPVIFGKSSDFKGRGDGFILSKIDSFDSMDESWSQWMDAIRHGRAKDYIPDNLVPKTAQGKPIAPNPFDNRYIAIGSDMSENANNRIYTDTPVIQSDAYLQAYMTALDLCLQGVLSPSTLGIDTKKLDNAEAQREKEKTTLYTRQNCVKLINKVIPQLVIATLNAYNTINNSSLVDENITVNVNFGEYANPSFESQVETVGKAKTQGIMSIEQSVEEMYGDTKDKDWKEQEVQRIKEQTGIAQVDEASLTDDIDSIGF